MVREEGEMGEEGGSCPRKKKEKSAPILLCARPAGDIDRLLLGRRSAGAPQHGTQH